MNHILRIGYRKWKLLTAVVATLCLSAAATRTEAHNYTKQEPLVVACDWAMPPYEFVNAYGQPIGFHIDLLATILDKMGIPHRFEMKDWEQATRMFENHEADLITDPAMHYRSQPYCISRNILSYYKIKFATPKEGYPITSLEDLKKKAFIGVKKNDSITQNVLAQLIPGTKLDPQPINYGLSNVATHKCPCFAWNGDALEWKIKELDLADQLTIQDLEIPAGEFHVIILTIAAVFVMLNRLVKRRVTASTHQATDVTDMMRQALTLGGFSVMEYDIRHDVFTNRHNHVLPDGGINMQQFIDHLHPDEKDHVIKELQRLRDGQNGIWELHQRWLPLNIDKDKATDSDWHYINGHAIAEQDDNGQVRFIVGTVKDVTNEFEQERKDSELASKYIKIFDSTLTAMSFYDKNGMLLDLNENMRKLCELDRIGGEYFKKTSIFDTIFFGDYTRDMKDEFHVCQHMYYPELGIDKYIEARISPTFVNGELLYYVITAHDVTAERNMYLEQRRHTRQLLEANNKISRYEIELRYLLENSQMWVWYSDLKTQTIHITQSLRQRGYTQTFQEYAEQIDECCLQESLKELSNMTGNTQNINMTVLFKHTPVSSKPQWCSISGIPLVDAQGNPTGHFGICRDITKLMDIQEKLKQETARAEDSGKLKSVFLANMTHEIRTPLNAIVGFSDLLQVIDNPQERREFIRIIRNNCDMLMRLINDIIEASNMNQGPLAIEPANVDFAVAFNDICQTLAQRVQEQGIEFIVDNPFKNYRAFLDKGRMQQVITNFTTNAVKYTHKGHIKVGYDIRKDKRSDNGQEADGIYMYCEDTGAGIPKDKQASVFERFVKLNDYVQGTGLGLSICKNIADRCGGHIGVTSEGEGYGSTFWIWVPLRAMECS